MKVLISAATKHGATSEIAEAIGRALTERGVFVDVVAPEHVTHLDDYDAIVLGSAIYGGHWLDHAKDFISRFGPVLKAKSVWLFSTGPLGNPLKPDEEHAINASRMVDETGAREHRVFAGKLDRENLGFAERAMVMALRVPDGDYRDWPEITAWSNHIADLVRVA